VGRVVLHYSDVVAVAVSGIQWCELGGVLSPWTDRRVLK